MKLIHQPPQNPQQFDDLPEDRDDKSPELISWMHDEIFERYIKAPLRSPIYGVYRKLTSIWLSKKLQSITPFTVNVWLWGQRGNSYAFHRKRVNDFYPIRGKKILIAGCGTGRDVASWLKYKPRQVTGIDFFNYSKAWLTVTNFLKRKYPHSITNFQQGDLKHLSRICDEEFDIVGSDAVFEHIKDPAAVCREWYRILKPGGILYATFGPLWFGWHGDHFSGWDSVDSGFNHILLTPSEYQEYLNQKPYLQHSEDDGRTWIENNLFSYLKPNEYLNILTEANFHRLHVGVIIEPNALKCLSNNPKLRNELISKYSPIDLMISGMTIIFQKPSQTIKCP